MDTLFNTVTAMASRLDRYNHTDTNALVSIIWSLIECTMIQSRLVYHKL